MLDNLSNNFKKVFEYLKSKGIHEIWVSKDVDFSSEYPVGSIYIPTENIDIGNSVYVMLLDIDNDDTPSCSIDIRYNGSNICKYTTRKNKVVF